MDIIPELDKTIIELNGLNNPGNFCYIISAIQGLRYILVPFYQHHAQIISCYVELAKHINIFQSHKQFLQEFNTLLNDKETELIKIVNKIIPVSANTYATIINKFLKEQLKIACMLLLHDIIVKIPTSKLNKHHTIDTMNFIKMFNILAIENGVEYICNGQQNDSNEFLIILLDYLNDSVNYGRTCNIANKSLLTLTELELNEIELNERVKIQMQCYYYNTYSKEYSFFHEYLNTLILNVIKCVSCGFKQSSVNSSNNICCSIPNSNKRNTLYDCLDDYFKEETIEYKCDSCGETNDNIMVKRILDNKKYLIISLKKFTYDPTLQIMTKKHEHASYPLILNIANYSLVSNNCSNQTDYNLKSNSKYYLKSVINHAGMLNYGHYYTDTNYNDKWYRCNDDSINILGINKVVNSNAYILLYEKE